MSDEERNTILDHLVALRSLLNWLGTGVVALLIGTATLIVTDHFDQRKLRGEMDEMQAGVKPKVERLWFDYEYRTK